MKKCRSLIVVANFVLIICMAIPQVGAAEIGSTIGLSDKLSFNILADLESQALTFVKDRDGFVWIGTYVDGLYRFDGKNLKHYVKATGFILSNNVSAIMEDSQGHLWFATAGGGLSQYKKQTNKTRHFVHHPDDPKSLSSNSFFWAGKNIIKEDQKGFIWVGTIGGGLNRYDKTKDQFDHFRHDPNNAASISSDNIRAVFTDSRDRIWVGTEKGLNRFDRQKENFVRLDLDQESGMQKNGQKAAKIIMTIFKDRDGFIWIGTENNGLYRYNETKNEFSRFRYDPKNMNGIGSNRINFLMEDQKNNIWVSHENKFSVYSKATGNFVRYEGELHDLTMSFVDKTARLIWGLTDTGKIIIHNLEGNNFKQYEAKKDDKPGLSSEIVVSIYEDSNGILWISTIKGLNRFDPHTGIFTHYFHEPGNPESIPSTVDYSPGIYEDKNKVLWIGNSAPSALSIFDRESGKVVKTYYPDPSDPQAMPDAQQINKMIEDSDNTDLMWLSTAKGLVRFNKKTGEFKTFGRDNSWDLFEDDNGAIWISTWGNGIGRFDKKTQRFEYFRHNPDNPVSISDNLLVPIFIASDKSIWIGTENGLNLFDIKSKTFRSYKRSDGYPFDAIHSIGEDTLNNLWLGTNAGLVRFNPLSGKARAFTKEDGIRSMMFYANNGITSKSGEMWFGGTKGMNSFFPEQIRQNRQIPQIKLTEFKQGGEIINFGKAPERLKTITLDWTNNFFEFEFASLDYTSPKKNKYAYMLEGFDKEWFNSGYNNFGRYSGLGPGQYTLKLKGSNNDGVWNEDGISISINVMPPFWKTLWFYSIIALMIAGMIFIAVFYMIRLNFEVQERKKAEEKLVKSNDRLLMLDKLKDEFLANTSHELRTPLIGIIGLSESLIDGAAGPLEPKAKKDLYMIAASGQRLSNLVNDILDFSKLRHKDIQLKLMEVDMHSLADVVLAISRPIASSKPIVFENRIPKDLPFARGDENRLQQILFNLVGNAIKFTQQGKIVISAQIVDKLIEISVFDTGIGIPKDKYHTIFESFEQVDGSTEREYAGTGLGLAVSKQLVELHGGSIGLTSDPGEGSVFYFRIPISESMDQNLPDEKPVFKMMDLHTKEVAEVTREIKLEFGPLSTDQPNILVVDDEAVNLKVLSNHLSLEDYHVTQVSNGIDALDAIEQMDAKGRLFDLVLLDVMMPRMSGYEVCEKLREKYPPDKLPVVMLTAKNRAEDLAAGLKSGANDYLTKPFNKTELLARIKNQNDLKNLTRKREESQQALSDSEKQYRDLFNNLVDVFYRTDRDGRLTLVSPSFKNILGFSVEEAIGIDVAETLYVNSELRQDFVEQLKEKGMVEGFEAQLKRKDGSIIWAEASSRIYFDEQNNPAGVEGIFRDITRQKQAEQMRDMLATVIEQASEFILVTDTNGDILYVNPAFEVGTGYSKEEVIGKNPRILKSGKHEAEYYKDIWNTISRGEVWKGRISNKRKDNSFFEEEAVITPVKDPRGKIINYVAVKRDVTKEVWLEQQLLQAQKMESIGTLAGGIAHDFNNILASMMGYTEIGLMDTRDMGVKRSLEKILKAGNRAKGLVNQILTFSRQTEIEPRPVEAKNIVEEVIKLLRASLPSSIEIKQEILSESCILADPTQIHQILLNLCTNAGYAMRKEGGVLGIFLKNTEDPGANRQKQIQLVVTDTGEGMRKQVSQRAFDPFYTTKEKGQGTGMGLSVVHGIVKRYKGTIELESRPGKGTMVTITLPVFEETKKETEATKDQLLFGSEKILLVDDEKVQTELGKQLLEKLGYRVDTETDSVLALERFTKNPDAYDVIVTDMTMPKLSGDQLSKKMLSIRPDIPIVLCTGYNEQISEEKAYEIGIKGYAYKPVILMEMSKILRQVLDR